MPIVCRDTAPLAPQARNLTTARIDLNFSRAHIQTTKRCRRRRDGTCGPTDAEDPGSAPIPGGKRECIRLREVSRIEGDLQRRPTPPPPPPLSPHPHLPPPPKYPRPHPPSH